MAEVKHTDSASPYLRKVWIAIGIATLVIVVLLLLKATFGILLLVLAGPLIATYFRGLSGLSLRKTGWSNGLCLAVSVGGTILLEIALSWLIGSKLSQQVTELTDTFPATVENAKTQLAGTTAGRKIADQLSSPESIQNAKSVMGSIFTSTFGILGDLYVVLFIGIFFTVSPRVYKEGIVALIPPNGKGVAKDLLEKLGLNLRKWLKGKFFAMAVVFILTAAGLAIMGMPLWLVLALIAGLFNFIPNFGPLLAMIPAVLVGLSVSPGTAALVAGLYILIQIVESNFITPLVQQKLISIPPAMIIIAQLLISPLTGAWGLVLATPLLLIIMILVDELYIKKQMRTGQGT